MLQDSVRVTRGWSSNNSETRFNSAVNADLTRQIYMDADFTRVALCEEPPRLADLMRPNSTTSFLF